MSFSTQRYVFMIQLLKKYILLYVLSVVEVVNAHPYCFKNYIGNLKEKISDICITYAMLFIFFTLSHLK